MFTMQTPFLDEDCFSSAFFYIYIQKIILKMTGFLMFLSNTGWEAVIEVLLQKDNK